MDYLTIGQTFLTPSFDLDVKEERKLLRYLNFPDRSGVAEVIRKHVKNNTSDGGRPNCNYYNLFATILYGFAFDGCTLIQLETKCRYDLRYIHPMHRQRADYSSFARLIKNVITPDEHEIFAMVYKQIVKELDIKLEDTFVDGTKLEANANKYKFVWDSYTLCEESTITCLNGNKVMVATIENRHPKKKNSVFYVVEGCSECPFAYCCKRFTGNKNEDFKIFGVDRDMQRYRQQARDNLLSVKGIEIRVSKTIRVEGSAGSRKGETWKQRLENVGTEVILNALGMNIAKLFRYFETGRQSGFWTVPENLKPEKGDRVQKDCRKRAGEFMTERTPNTMFPSLTLWFFNKLCLLNFYPF